MAFLLASKVLTSWVLDHWNIQWKVASTFILEPKTFGNHNRGMRLLRVDVSTAHYSFMYAWISYLGQNDLYRISNCTHCWSSSQQHHYFLLWYLGFLSSKQWTLAKSKVVEIDSYSPYHSLGVCTWSWHSDHMKPYEGLWEDYLNLVVFLFVPVHGPYYPFCKPCDPGELQDPLCPCELLDPHGARDPIVNLLVQGPWSPFSPISPCAWSSRSYFSWLSIFSTFFSPCGPADFIGLASWFFHTFLPKVLLFSRKCYFSH